MSSQFEIWGILYSIIKVDNHIFFIHPIYCLLNQLIGKKEKDRISEMHFHVYTILIFTSVYCQCFLDTLYVGCYKWKRLKKKDLGVVVQCFIARMKDGFRKEDLSIDEIGESTSNNKVSFIHFLPRGKPSSAVQMPMNIIKIVKKILSPKYWYCKRIIIYKLYKLYISCYF